MSKLPKQLSCPECKENGEHRIHWAFICDDHPDGKWSWDIMNHDQTSKFKWPVLFDSNKEAKAHLNSILKDSIGEQIK